MVIPIIHQIIFIILVSTHPKQCITVYYHRLYSKIQQEHMMLTFHHCFPHDVVQTAAPFQLHTALAF